MLSLYNHVTKFLAQHAICMSRLCYEHDVRLSVCNIGGLFNEVEIGT